MDYSIYGKLIPSNTNGNCFHIAKSYPLRSKYSYNVKVDLMEWIRNRTNNTNVHNMCISIMDNHISGKPLKDYYRDFPMIQESGKLISVDLWAIDILKSIPAGEGVLIGITIT